MLIGANIYKLDSYTLQGVTNTDRVRHQGQPVVRQATHFYDVGSKEVVLSVLKSPILLIVLCLLADAQNHLRIRHYQY